MQSLSIRLSGLVVYHCIARSTLTSKFSSKNMLRFYALLPFTIVTDSDISILKIILTSHSNSILVRQFPFLF